MRLNPVMDKFYQGIIEYAGLELKDDIIVNKSEKLGEFTLDDQHIALPYLDLLKNPQGKTFFHLLNENYTQPENTLFNMFKDRLVLELNLRLSALVTSLIAVASDVQLQKRIRSSVLLDLVGSISEADHSVIEAFLGMVKASGKQNNEGYLVDIYLKKNGEINGTPYAAIGKLNFRMAEEIERSLNAPEKDYKVFGAKFRKKDLMIISEVLAAIFPNGDPNKYIEGTDNKVFRYLNILLKTAYMVSARINEIAGLLEELNEPMLNVEGMISPHDWVEALGELQGMATEIRMIPSQVNIATEAKHMKLDESKAATVAPQQPAAQPQQTSFDPNVLQQQQVAAQPVQAQQQQPVAQAPRQLTPEEIIRGGVSGVNPMQPQMMMQQPVMLPNGMMMMPNGTVVMAPQMPQQQTGGLQLNPMFMNQTPGLPWN